MSSKGFMQPQYYPLWDEGIPPPPPRTRPFPEYAPGPGMVSSNFLQRYEGHEMQQMDVGEMRGGKKSFSYYLFTAIYSMVYITFLVLCIYALATVRNNSKAIELCGQELWTVLLLHITLPILLSFVFVISTLLISPFLLQCTHKNPLCLFLIPLILFTAYNSTMLAMGVRFILDAEMNKEGCVAALTEASKGASPDLPLLIVLSWVFVAIDSLCLLGETCAFIFLICVQMNFMVSNTEFFMQMQA